jgi:hypothetical protein
VRSVKLVALAVGGNEQVARPQVLALLAAEDLRVGAVLLWPDDARVQRARARLLATESFERVTLQAAADRGRRRAARGSRSRSRSGAAWR